jgi:hypothetical protein
MIDLFVNIVEGAAMSDTLLTTKLYVPQTPPELVPRPHLAERLSEGLARQLTLVSAPAGFGKSTLVTGWLAETGHTPAWLSLDQGDNDRNDGQVDEQDASRAGQLLHGRTMGLPWRRSAHSADVGPLCDAGHLQ